MEGAAAGWHHWLSREVAPRGQVSITLIPYDDHVFRIPSTCQNKASHVDVSVLIFFAKIIKLSS